MKKFLLGKTPSIRLIDEKGPSTNRMMIDLLIALTPIIIFSWVKNGLMPFINLPGVSVLSMLYPLLLVICGALSSFVLEAIYFWTFLKVRDFKTLMKTVWHSYAIIPGILLALTLPLNTPIIVLLFGCFLANIVFKMLFGGLGHNIFNPALIAYVIVVATFGLTNANLNPQETIDVVTGVTPLTHFGTQSLITYENIVAPYGTLWDFFLGTVPGCLGATSILLCLVGYIYLVIRKVINWKTPLIYCGTFFIITCIISLVGGYGWWYPVYQLFAGSLVFGAVFMATEPVTTPKNPIGKVIFAVGLGVLTALFRLVTPSPDGVATAILVMCLFTPVIDRSASIMRTNKFTYKTALKVGLISVIYLAIAVYTIIKVGGAN